MITKKLRQVWVAALLCWLSCAPGFGAITTEALGHITVEIKGHGGTAPSALSFLGIGLMQAVLYRGNVDSASGTSIITAESDWAGTDFGAHRKAYFLEITSGPASGYVVDIVDGNSGSKTLVVATDVSQTLAGGESFKIRKHWTLAALFGPNNEAGLGSGSNTTADEIFIYDPLGRTYTTYFYKTIGLGGRGWRSTRSTSIDESEAPLDARRGILVRRKQSDDLTLRLFGEIKSGNTMFPILPGLNLVANSYPTDGLTLGNSGLYTGDAATGLAGGTIGSADKILIYTGTAYNTYFYETSPGTGWRSAADPSADASNTPIPAGASLLVLRANNGPAFYWLLKQPY